MYQVNSSSRSFCNQCLTCNLLERNDARVALPFASGGLDKDELSERRCRSRMFVFQSIEFTLIVIEKLSFFHFIIVIIFVVVVVVVIILFVVIFVIVIVIPIVLIFMQFSCCFVRRLCKRNGHVRFARNRFRLTSAELGSSIGFVSSLLLLLCMDSSL